MKKAPEAFRTISEVAEILDTPAHVLRFWESKFYQIRPVKRAGGRRYYRPDDVSLISGIKALLQDQGMTIRGVQRVLQEQGVRHVAGLAGPMPAFDPDHVEAPEAAPEDVLPESPPSPRPAARKDAAQPAKDTVIPFQPAGSPPARVMEEESLDDEEIGPEEAEDIQPLDAVFAAQDQGLAADLPEEAATADLPEVEEPPAGTEVEADEDPNEALDLAAARMADIAPDRRIELKDTLEELAEDAETLEPSERALLARHLRGLPRGALGPRRDRAELIARRIDALLERMSEASGAGRW